MNVDKTKVISFNHPTDSPLPPVLTAGEGGRGFSIPVVDQVKYLGFMHTNTGSDVGRVYIALGPVGLFSLGSPNTSHPRGPSHSWEPPRGGHMTCRSATAVRLA